MDLDKPRRAYLCLDSWAGRSRQLVDVVRETQTKYVIRAIGRTKLAGRDRWLNAGEMAKVPKMAIIWPIWTG